MDVESAAFEVEDFVYLGFVHVFFLQLLTINDVGDQLFYLFFSQLASIFMELRKVANHLLYSGTRAAQKLRGGLALTIVTLVISKTLVDTSLIHDRINQMSFIQFNFGRARVTQLQALFSLM